MSKTPLILAALLLAGGPALAAGDHGHAVRAATKAAPTRTIEIIAGDIYFEPSRLEVTPGETVRLIVRNQGNLLHEFRIGTPEQNLAHEAEMAEMVDHGMFTPTGIDHAMMKSMGHGTMHAIADGSASGVSPLDGIVIEPGQVADLTWTVPNIPNLEFACTIPGHLAGGMAGPVDLKAR